jgi:hypothetical protein
LLEPTETSSEIVRLESIYLYQINSQSFVSSERSCQQRQVPIENNSVKQLTRQVAAGRKERCLVANVESAKRHRLDAWKYPRNILDRIVAEETDYAKQMPEVWKQEHPEAVRVYRKEESRYKADRKQVTRARRIVAAKLIQLKSWRNHLTQPSLWCALTPKVHYFESVAVRLCSSESGKGGIVDILSIG